jgi:hypothetical protein
MDLSIGVGRKEGFRLVEMDGDVYRFDQAYRCTRKEADEDAMQRWLISRSSGTS